MQSKRWATGFVASLGVMLAAAAFAGGEPDPITLGIDNGAANIGGTVEILVTIDAGDTQPSTLVIFIAYDPAKLAPAGDAFEFTFSDSNGDPVLDSDGNAITFRSIVRPEAVLQGRNKAIDTEVLDEGVLGIAIQGGTARIPDGPLLTATFSVLGGASPNEMLDLDGVDEDAPIPVTNDDGGLSVVFSSAAVSVDNGQGGLQTLAIPVSHADGIVQVGCVPVAEQPQSVSASQGQPDAVVISWDAVATPGAEYRVYRSNDQNIVNAVPLGSAWSASTFFTDITALAPETQGAGCSCNANANVFNHYYWVRARTPQGCEGPFSAAPVLGNRGTAKAASAAARASATVFPAGTTAGAVVPVALDTPAAMRAEGKRPDDALLHSTSGASLSIVSAGAEAWWLVATPDTAWAADEAIILETGASVRIFRADASLPREARRAKGVQVTFADESAAPWLPEGVGVPYAVGPAGVFAAPHTVWLPVPKGEDPEALILYAYHASNGARAWYYAENLAGLVAGVPEYRNTPQGDEIGFSLRHGAVVQLGQPVAYAAPAAASVLPVSYSQLFHSNAGGILIFLVLASVLIMAARHRRGAFHATK